MFRLLFNFIIRAGYLLKSKNSLVKKQIGNHIMYLDLKDSGLSATLIRKKRESSDREAAFMKILRQEVKEGMTGIDIGANIGYVTLIMAELVGSSGRIYAIEPDPRNFKILSKNIEANGYANFVFPYQMGISNISGISKFYVSDKSNLCSIIPTKHSKSSIDITVSTLDDFLKDKGFPDFIKMDIEGHEVEVLEGMYNTLKSIKSSVKILMEVHPMYYSKNHSLEKQLRRLIDIGFDAKYVVSAGIAKPDFFYKHGYEPVEIFHTDGWCRGIYTDISNEHMLMAACYEQEQFIKHKNLHTKKIVRAIMMIKKSRA